MELDILEILGLCLGTLIIFGWVFIGYHNIKEFKE
tara:strand:+ start:2791 stop:2895 length:105 start_codon:yes stop_codon:yes gene_type:complete